MWIGDAGTTPYYRLKLLTEYSENIPLIENECSQDVALREK